MHLFRRALVFAALLFATGAEARAADGAADNTRGAVEQTGGRIVPQKPSLPKLNLTTAQREQIRLNLLAKDTQIEFKMKETKPAESFTPEIGAELPKSIKPHGIPAELIQQIPQLGDYAYVKMKNHILLVNAMTKKVVEIIPEAQPQTTNLHER
jgi:hypothetical protein